MAEPTDKELAVMYRWTLHTKWGFSGFMGTGGEEDFTCRCEQCTSSRRKRWLKEQV
jgi:hypothetical protein